MFNVFFKKYIEFKKLMFSKQTVKVLTLFKKIPKSVVIFEIPNERKSSCKFNIVIFAKNKPFFWLHLSFKFAFICWWYSSVQQDSAFELDVSISYEGT